MQCAMAVVLQDFDSEDLTLRHCYIAGWVLSSLLSPHSPPSLVRSTAPLQREVYRKQLIRWDTNMNSQL